MAISKVWVSSAQELESAITSYLAKGFVVANRTPTTVTLQKKKEFSVLWAVIGFLLCILPLLIYLVVYASKADVEIVEISIRPQGALFYVALPVAAGCRDRGD